MEHRKGKDQQTRPKQAIYNKAWWEQEKRLKKKKENHSLKSSNKTLVI